MVLCEKQEPCLFQMSYRSEVLGFQGVRSKSARLLPDKTAVGQINDTKQ